MSVDVFESNMFWVNREDGSVMQQDKFGRGVPVTLVKNLANPLAVKVLHPYRYNKTLHNPCLDRHCSHLCVLTPGKRTRCQCPDGQNFVDQQQSACDAAFISPLAQPLICKCRNGGWCQGDGSCYCEPGFHGEYCENGKTAILTGGNSSSATFLVPIFLVFAIVAVAIGIFIHYRKDKS